MEAKIGGKAKRQLSNSGQLPSWIFDCLGRKKRSKGEETKKKATHVNVANSHLASTQNARGNRSARFNSNSRVRTRIRIRMHEPIEFSFSFFFLYHSIRSRLSLSFTSSLGLSLSAKVKNTCQLADVSIPLPA